MSDKFYAFLLHLYPSHFRNAYGEQALQLYRDRARAETGFLPTLCLWIDLLADLAISLPREYAKPRPILLASTLEQHTAGLPDLFVLDEHAPPPRALFYGSIFTLGVLGVFSFLLIYPGSHAGRWLAALQSLHEGSAVPELQTSPSANDGLEEAGAPLPEVNFTLDLAERQRVVESAASKIKQHYVDRENARKIAASLLKHARNGDDDAVTDGEAFANLLTHQMREISPDRNLTLDYFQSPLPQHAPANSSEDLARYRQTMQRQNCTFEKVEILPYKIGYLRLNSFPDLSVCKSTAAVAMASLNHADAMIFDLRDNRGGYPNMVTFLASYLFDHPEYLYNPRENTTEQSWTHSPVPGNNLADKPAYILTSARTFSGAEQFSYDLKMLKRATLVGEKTGGAAHSGVFYRIDNHFGMGIPEARPVNPFVETDWAEVGVEPDISAKPEAALATALKLARAKLQKK